MRPIHTSSEIQMRNQLPKLWAVTRREYLEWVRSPWFIIATLFGPILFAILIALPIYLTERPVAEDSGLEDYRTALYNINVLDATTTGVGERIAQIIGGGKYANQPMPLVRVIPADELNQAEQNAIRETKEERISGYIIIDSTTVLNGNSYYAGRKADSRIDMLNVKNAIREGLVGYRLEERGFSPGQIDSITIIEPQIQIEPINAAASINLSDARMLLATFITILLYASIVLYGQSMLSSVVEEKTTRMSEVIVSSIRPATLLSGKILGISAVGLTQQIVWVLMVLGIIAALGGQLPASALGINEVIDLSGALPLGTLAAFVTFFLLGIIFYGSLYAAVGATVSSESDARHAAQPVVILLVASMLFFQPVLNDPSGFWAKALTLFPISAPILMPLRMAITDVPATEVALSYLLLIVACMAIVRLAARIYRVGLLMYGKRPSFNELRRWLSY